MIRLIRVRTAAAVKGGLRGNLLRDKNLRLLKLKQEKGVLTSADFNSAWWKAAKEQIKTESRGKCAYCEANTSVVAHGDVEHFRPKDRYWWLAYCYDNYLYACQICNESYKSNHFPIAGVPLPEPPIPPGADEAQLQQLAATLTPDPIAGLQDGSLDAFHQANLAENSHLPDPYLIDPESLLAWIPDEDLREVRVAAAAHLDNAAAITDAIERYYGLNREELRRLRWRIYDELRKIRGILERTDDPVIRDDARAIIALRTSPDAEYAGMCRFFVRVWKL